jgi:polyisoprenoid-binding protein YceI
MTARRIQFALLGVAVLIGILAYAFLRSPAPASAPIQSVAIQSQVSQSEQATSGSVQTRQVFEIQPDESAARFIVDEILRGSPNRVVGTTNQIAGQISVNPEQPSDAQVGTILINARTLVTDDNQRNNAIRRFILQTDEHEFISFTPTAVHGLPNNASLGQSYAVQLVGDLTIRDTTAPAVFDATVTPVSANRLEGQAATTIRYADWGITIIQVPFVAGVAENVRLELDLVATAL